MGKRAPLSIGQIFGRLTVVGEAPSQLTPTGDTVYCVIVECVCGGLKAVRESSLKKGNTTSCGCWPSERMTGQTFTTHHGMSFTGTYYSWGSMIARCTNPKNKSYKDYGGRGIRVCERWMTFENFFADIGEKPKGLSIERIDNDGNYEPGNCKWTDRASQAKNQRSNRYVILGGESMIVADAARRLNMRHNGFYARIAKHGETLQKAVDYYAAKKAA